MRSLRVACIPLLLCSVACTVSTVARIAPAPPGRLPDDEAELIAAFRHGAAEAGLKCPDTSADGNDLAFCNNWRSGTTQNVEAYLHRTEGALAISVAANTRGQACAVFHSVYRRVVEVTGRDRVQPDSRCAR